MILSKRQRYLSTGCRVPQIHADVVVARAKAAHRAEVKAHVADMEKLHKLGAQPSAEEARARLNKREARALGIEPA